MKRFRLWNDSFATQSAYMSLYQQRGVSAQKEEVHAATRSLDPGLFPKAFCKIYPDYLGNDPAMVNLMHADGAGTKSILAYLYWKETGDLSVWKGIAQDAIVMNLDDLICTGIYDNIVFNSTIDRNKHLIPVEVLAAIIEGSEAFFQSMRSFGINIHYLGGETADVGDVVRTIAVNGTMTSRWPKHKIVTNERIQAGDVIVGLASDGQSAYETVYNSGIGSNGLTSARHDMLSGFYRTQYTESFDPALPESVTYIGKHRLTDAFQTSDGQVTDIGHLILSPTRTFAPVVKALLEADFDAIHGLIHCSGGGQTKCLKYIPDQLRIVKDNLFPIPDVFRLIQEQSGSNNREMLQVFNMGCRLEIYCAPDNAARLQETAAQFGIQSRIIGRVEAAPAKELLIHWNDERLVFQG
jgi:phosphoribosylformylglycinamidine cyclo-ligase